MNTLHPLTTGVDHPAPQRGNAVPGLTIVGLLAAPVAWFLQLLISYGLQGDTCRGLVPSLLSASWGTRPSLAVAVEAIAAVVCAFGLGAAARNWRLTRNEGPGDHHAALSSGHGRTRFLALCGIIGSAIFLLATLFALIIPFLVPSCAALSA